MKLVQLSFAWMLIYLHIPKANCANILIVWPWYLQSHFKSYQILFEELVNRKHNITLISGYQLKNTLQSKYIFINVSRQFPKSKMADVIKKVKSITLLEYSKMYIHISTDYVDRVLGMPEVQQVIQSDSHYDLVISEFLLQDAFFAFGNKFNAPTIALSPMKLVPVYNWWLCDPHSPSFVMNQFLRMPGEMTLTARIINTVYNFILVMMFELIAVPRYQNMIEEHFHFDEENVPQIKDIIKNISVIFATTHYSLGYIKPELPNIVSVGGIHLTPLKTLPANIQKFMDEAESGVIYLSLGSTIEPTAFDDLGNKFVEILGRLPQRVLMKWNRKLLQKVPSNFMVQEWIPQAEVLNHPKSVLFITHGGILSCLETVNASVPVVGIPVFSDQHYNLAVMEYYEMGTMLQLEEVPLKLADQVDEVLNNPKYKHNIKKRSMLFRERLVKPMDEAMYWIDHVLKHEDTVHLKSAELQLSWYERFSLDVLFILTVIISLTIYLTKCCLIWLVQKVIFCIKIRFSDKICNSMKSDDHTKSE